MSAVLEFESVSKVYGEGDAAVVALDGVSLAVGPAEFVALRGPSGCGKSTALHLAGGLDRPTAGLVRVAGRDIGGLNPRESARLRRDVVGYVFQRLNLIPGLTALENVMLPLELVGDSGAGARSRSLEALALVGLKVRLDRYPDDFSGGQQQRIAIARALVGRRSLLLADEPTGALDTASAEEVMAVLESLPAASGTAVVLVTHEPRYATRAQRVVSMRDGRVVGVASASPVAP